MTEGVGSDAHYGLASAVVIAILTIFVDRVAVLHTLHITSNSVFGLGVKERVPHVGVWSLSTADSMHSGHAIGPFAFEKRSCQTFTASHEIAGSLWLPWPDIRGAVALLVCAGNGKVGMCV